MSTALFFSGVALIVGTMAGEYSFVLQWVAVIVGTMTGDYIFVLQWLESFAP